MATLLTKVIPHAGLKLAAGDWSPASAGGDHGVAGSGVLLLVKNGDSAQHTVTLTVPETVDSLAVEARPVPVPAGDQALIPLLDLYTDPATGLAGWTYDGVTNVSVVAVRS